MPRASGSFCWSDFSRRFWALALPAWRAQQSSPGGLRLPVRTVAVSSSLKAAVKPCRCASLLQFGGLQGAQLLPPGNVFKRV